MEPKVCLALGGGAARGLAHLGVLKVCEEAGVRIDLIAGTSLGALIGGCYAYRPDAAYWTSRVDQYLRSFRSRKTRLEFIRRLEEPAEKNHGFFNDMAHLIRKGYFWGVTATKPAFISEQEYEEFIYPLIPDVAIESLKIPFGCVATDIRNGTRAVFRTGPLRRAVSASCALPGIFPPVADGDRLLVDGGWIERVPVHCARDMGADIVIAVDVSSEIERFEARSGLDVVMRADAVSRVYLNEILVRDADIVLHPAVGGTHWADFSNVGEVIRQGETAALEKIGQIKTLIRAASAAGVLSRSLVGRLKGMKDRILRKVSGGR
jgi:NTE family protein